MSIIPTDKVAEKVCVTGHSAASVAAYAKVGNPRALAGSVPAEGAMGFQQSGNSFVWSVVRAYCDHNELVLRPDDVWLAIMIQFSNYVNAVSRVEALRDRFVKHSGQKEIVVEINATLDTIPYEEVLDTFSRVIDRELVDEIRTWVQPSFTTTRREDRTVASVVMMATVRSYFKYTLRLRCGLPKVTLLGTVEDWEAVRDRAVRLHQYAVRTGGDDVAAGENVMDSWCGRLMPVLAMIVHTFREPESAEARDFWNRICSYHPGGSGPSHISGWITAFCAFTEKGEYQLGPVLGYGDKASCMVDMNNIPGGYAYAPLTIEMPGGLKIATTLLAGHFLVDTPTETSVQPRLDWIIAAGDSPDVWEAQQQEVAERYAEDARRREAEWKVQADEERAREQEKREALRARTVINGQRYRSLR